MRCLIYLELIAEKRARGGREVEINTENERKKWRERRRGRENGRNGKKGCSSDKETMVRW